MRTLIVAILALLACGCVLSDAPIRAEDGPAFDTRLAGVWTDKDGTFFMHMGSKEGAGQLILVERAESGEMKSSETSIVTACLSGGCFLSVLGDAKYDLIKYAFSESGTLTLHHGNMEFWKSAIEAGLVRGRYSGPEFATVALHATEAELRDFVTKYADRLFSGDKPLNLSKVK